MSKRRQADAQRQADDFEQAMVEMAEQGGGRRESVASIGQAG
jgi:hypothetical protein